MRYANIDGIEDISNVHHTSIPRYSMEYHLLVKYEFWTFQLRILIMGLSEGISEALMKSPLLLKLILLHPAEKSSLNPKPSLHLLHNPVRFDHWINIIIYWIHGHIIYSAFR